MPSGGNRYGHLGLQMEKINLLDDNMSDLITPLPLEGTFFCFALKKGIPCPQLLSQQKNFPA